MEIEAVEVVPGEVDVAVAGGPRCRVVIPAGVGVAGADDDELAASLVRVLMGRDRPLDRVVDASRVFASHPDVLAAVQEDLDAHA